MLTLVAPISMIVAAGISAPFWKLRRAGKSSGKFSEADWSKRALERARQYAHARYLRFHPTSMVDPQQFQVGSAVPGTISGRGCITTAQGKTIFKTLRNCRVFRIDISGPDGQEEMYVLRFDDAYFEPTFASGVDAYRFILEASTESSVGRPATA